STDALFWRSAEDGRRPSLFFCIVENPLLWCDPCRLRAFCGGLLAMIGSDCLIHQGRAELPWRHAG
ncbi:hypothetical protein ABTL08_19305, partial [Acinetobacter baumannii]